MTIGRKGSLLITLFIVFVLSVTYAQKRNRIKVTEDGVEQTETKSKKGKKKKGTVTEEKKIVTVDKEKERLKIRQRWVDSVYTNLSDTERIGQLFMVAAYSGGKDYNEARITDLVANRRIGGVIYMQGTAEAQARQTNKLQQMAQVPLLIGMDAEWGLGMRLTGVKDYPRAMMMGASRDTALAYRMGRAVADQCRRLGVHINFAPVVDVNNNPNNPIINARSFGEDKEWVSLLGIAYMKGMQDNGVIACAKHFPGHGDTDVDSHKDMPAIHKTLQQLDTLELYPFKKLIMAGIGSVMVAHLEVPAIEPEPRIPTTLSYNTITGLLKNKMGFKGLVFTDALNMDGIAKYYAPGEVDLKAFMAGNDMLLFSQDVPTAIAKMQAALADGRIQPTELEQRVKKVLAAKYDVGLNQVKMLDTNNVTADVNRYTAGIRNQMARAAVTLVRDRNNVLNRINDKDIRVGYVGVNASGTTVLYEQLQQSFGNMKVGWVPKGTTETVADRVADNMSNNDITIVGIHNMSFYPGSGGTHGIDFRQISFLRKMQTRSDVIVVLMGNAYLLKNICNASSVIVGYEDDSATQVATADILMQRAVAKGNLPVTPCAGMTMEPRNMAAVTRNVEKAAPTKVPAMQRAEFPEDAGVTSPAALDKINTFVASAIAQKAFPGCRVLAAKDGKVFYDESFGYYDYTKQQRVTGNTMYDVASLTKVLSTTLAVMRLYETGKLDLNKTLGNYLAIVKGTDKEHLRIRDLLLHQAGLKAWIPFYNETLDKDGSVKMDLYHAKPDNRYNTEVAKNLYLRNDYKDTIWNRILNSNLENKGKSVYSDLDFYFLAAVVEQLTGQTIDKYVDEQFYKPLGLKATAYNPLKKFGEQNIAPTEEETTFRKQLLRGYVHDQGAALLGGVAGHAGLFATAQDVATIFQMLLNGGTYGGKRYFAKETVTYFTAYNSSISRRGLGFDKPSADAEDGGPAGNRVSGYAFGHQGFTGTCAWADPGTGIVFVFLSNRVLPSSTNTAINKLGVRTMVQDYVYEAFGYPNNRTRPDVQRKQLAK